MEQADVHMPRTTVREALVVSCSLRLPDAKKDMVNVSAECLTLIRLSHGRHN